MNYVLNIVLILLVTTSAFVVQARTTESMPISPEFTTLAQAGKTSKRKVRVRKEVVKKGAADTGSKNAAKPSFASQRKASPSNTKVLGYFFLAFAALLSLGGMALFFHMRRKQASRWYQFENGAQRMSSPSQRQQFSGQPQSSLHEYLTQNQPNQPVTEMEPPENVSMAAPITGVGEENPFVTEFGDSQPLSDAPVSAFSHFDAGAATQVSYGDNTESSPHLPHGQQMTDTQKVVYGVAEIDESDEQVHQTRTSPPQPKKRKRAEPENPFMDADEVSHADDPESDLAAENKQPSTLDSQPLSKGARGVFSHTKIELDLDEDD